MSPFAVGDAVVLLGEGVGTIRSLDDGRVVVGLAEGSATVPVADLDGLLRPVVERQDAEVLLRRLCERAAEARALPQLRASRELSRAPLQRQVEYARLYFRKKKLLHPAEIDMIAPVIEHVVAELAVALGVDDADLRAAAKRGVPEVTRRTVRALPPARVLEGANHLRSFWVGRLAVIGEAPEKMGLKVATRPGAWHAYKQDARASGAGRLEGLLVCHAEANVAGLLASAMTYVGQVEVEGGVLGLIDADAPLDPGFGADEVERTRRQGQGFGDRGVEVSTLGDGKHQILVDCEDAATCILVPF